MGLKYEDAMPFDAADFQPDSTHSQAARCRSRCNVQLGVFSHDGVWKIYSQFDQASAFSSRGQALEAAWARAREAVRAGGQVELFVQDEDGGLRQAVLDQG